MDTPISLLNLICIQNNTKADYTLLSREGQVHLPTFTYRVQVNEHSEEGSGQSKKKAKHLAAKKMIQCLIDDKSITIKEEHQDMFNKMDNIDESTEAESTELNPNKQKQEINNTDCNEKETQFSASDLGNPIGRLQEICMKKHWHPPIYEESESTGLPHERMFTFKCCIKNMNLEIEGSGKSKKLAKRDAAEKMFTFLVKQCLDKVDEILDRIPKRDQQEGCFNLRSEIMAFKSNKNRIKEKKIDSFFKNMLSDPKVMDKISSITDDYLDFVSTIICDQVVPDVEKTMQELAEIMNCEVISRLHREKSQIDQYQYFAELIGKEGQFENFALLTTWATDDQIEKARQKAISLLILDCIFFIKKSFCFN